MIKRLLSLFLFCFGTWASAQEINLLDSLLNSPLDNNGHSVFEQKINEFIDADPQQFLVWSKNWEEWAKKKDRINQAKVLKYQGLAYYYLEQSLEAANTFIACGRLLENQGTDYHDFVAECYKNAAINYRDLELFEYAIDWAKKSLAFVDKKTSPNILVWDYAVLGEVYFVQGDYNQALIYYDSCLIVDRFLNDTVHISEDLGVLGRINASIGREKEGIKLLKEALDLLDSEKYPRAYCKALNALGLGYIKQEEFQIAEQYLLEALSLAQSIKDTNLVMNRLINLGELHNQLGNYELAEGYLMRSLNLLGEEYHARRLTFIYKNLANVYQQRKEYAKAIQYYDRAHLIAEEKSLLPQLKIIYKNLLKINKDIGDFKEALAYAEKFQTISDSLLSLDVRNSASAFNFNYQTAKKEAALLSLQHANELKEQDLKHIKRQKSWLLLTLILSLLLGSLGFYAFRQKQQSLLKIKEAKIEKQLIEISRLQREIAFALEENEKPAFSSLVSFDSINHLLSDPLSEREFHILKLVAEGYNNKEIADQVFVSVNTVKYHLKNIYAKLEVKNRIQAAKVIMKNHP